MKIIDNKYCLFENENSSRYNYNKRNKSTSLVHALLSMAIMETIEKCDIGIFLESENSTMMKLDDIQTKTLSPWIYQEINMMVSIKRRKPKWLGEAVQTFSREGPLKMKFNIPIDNLITIDAKLLNSISGSDHDSWLKNFYDTLNKNYSSRKN